MKFTIATVIVFGQVLAALKASDYPALDVVPKVNQQWADLFLKGVSIPNTPIRPKGSGPSANADQTPDQSACKSPNDWALTYDDGSSPFTPAVVSALGSKNAKATFFIVGSRLVTHDRQLKQAYDAGHQIALHSWSHAPFTTLTNEEIVTEMVWTSKIVRDIIGVSPKHIRVPHGDIDPRVRAVLKAMDFEIISWSRDTNDWKTSRHDTAPTAESNPQTIVTQFTAWAKERTGAISLQHDIYGPPTSIVGATLDVLTAANFNLKTVATCLDIPAYDNFVHAKINGNSTGPTTSSTRVSVTSMPATKTAEPTQTGSASATATASTKPVSSSKGLEMSLLYLIALF